MKDKKKIITNILVLIIMIVLTFVFIFKNYDFNETIETILSVNYIYVIFACISMLLYIFFEALNVKQVLKSLDIDTSILSSIKYTIIGFFGSGITPGGSGGQPLEIYFMKRDGIRVSASMITLLIEICSFHLVTIFFGLAGLILHYHILSSAFLFIFSIGLTIKLIVVTFMLISLFNKKLANKIVDLVNYFLKKFKFFNTQTIQDSIKDWMDDYGKASDYIKKHKIVFIKSTLIVALQVIMHYSVSFFVYKSFGFTEYSYLSIVFVQAILYVATSSIPLPGSVGISETSFLMIYTSIFGYALTSAMLLQRFVTFYLFMIISFIVLIINSYRKKKIKA